jgi:hypothetical protein
VTQWVAESDPEYSFWIETLQAAGAELRSYIKDLSTHIVNSSKSETFYLFFQSSNLGERECYQLMLGINGISNYPEEGDQEPYFKYIWEQFVESFKKYRDRFQKTKFFDFFRYTTGMLKYISAYPNGLRVVPVREFLGNYYIPITLVLKRVFTLRFNTPRRLKRKVFRRGYDDKGTESTISDRARRQANTVEYPYLTKDFLAVLRLHKDPIGLLRDLGYIREQEE